MATTKGKARPRSPLKSSAGPAARHKPARRKTGAGTAPRKWSQHVTETSNAMDLQRDVFTLDAPKAIAASLKRSAERSHRRKSAPFRSAMSMLTFYINRAGQSATAVKFESSTPPSGTKFGSCHRSQRSAFLHIENIQPRIRDRSVAFPNDAIAPEPGFSEAQLERLALVYVIASVRSGKWLIPAYHSPIDLGYPDRHDDPQNFDLQTWAAKLNALIAEINAQNGTN